jgi:hypothetical protein
MRIIKFTVLSFLICFFTLCVYADEFNPLVYHYNNPEVTVEFSEPLSMSLERQQSIADQLAGVIPNSMIDPSISDPENIICSIFGHNLAPTGTVTVTHHKAKTYNPRCLKDVYHVVYCTRCDYAMEELYDSFYVFCCPED